MGAEIRYLLAASGATINDNREATNDATMTSATPELVQEDAMFSQARSCLAAITRGIQTSGTQTEASGEGGTSPPWRRLDLRWISVNQRRRRWISGESPGAC